MSEEAKLDPAVEREQNTLKDESGNKIYDPLSTYFPPPSRNEPNINKFEVEKKSAGRAGKKEEVKEKKELK